ncbi:MAG: ribonuclease E/G, partial [Rhodospirillales bacterium]|nr:ribonuclease E/G [Rhodospirillales bacterium]
QLRLRDLAGLIVIDFIDMESKRHNAMVERRLKEALKNDRARIQVGHISHFGLLEMSRQRLRPSLAETSFIPCPHCGGTGHVRSTESAAIHVLRAIEEEGAKRRAAEVVVHMAPAIAMFILNHKRERLREIELRHGLRTILAADDKLIAPEIRIERVRAPSLNEGPMAVTLQSSAARIEAPMGETPVDEAEDVADAAIEDDAEERAAPEPRSEARGEGQDEAGTEDGDGRKRRRRRRRGRGRGRDEGETDSAATRNAGEDAGEDHEAGADEEGAPAAETASEGGTASEAASEPTDEEGGEAAAERARRRGRRGGRRRRRDGDPAAAAIAAPGAEQPEMPDMFQPGGMPYVGPTPADPFGGQAFDIFDVLERAEEAQSARQRPAAETFAPPAAPAPAAAELATPRPTAPELATPESPTPEPTAAQPTAPEPATPALVAADAALPQAAIADAPPPAPAPAADVAAAPAVAREAAIDEHTADGQDPAQPEAAAAAAPEAAPVEAAPVIQPVLVGGDAAPAEKKRGWWRR